MPKLQIQNRHRKHLQVIFNLTIIQRKSLKDEHLIILKDNTVNIENIYASQIVEEIRRERERKVLQKEDLKALQQKRQQNKDNEEDQIQKAIDEMYAKQAHQYIGESSLDEDHNDEDMNDGQSNNVSESTTTTSFKKTKLALRRTIMKKSTLMMNNIFKR